MVVGGEKPTESILFQGMPKRKVTADNHFPLGKHFPGYYTLAFWEKMKPIHT